MGQTSSLKFLSYNTGLAHGFVPYADKRLGPIINVLNESPADVICLQEVWSKKDQKKIKKALRDRYPYSVTPKNHQFKVAKSGRKTCKMKDLFGEGKFVTCILDTCGDKTGEEKDSCVANDCRKSLDALAESNSSCADALMASVGKNEVAAILSLLNPFSRPGKFSYGGGFGTMLFSKVPFNKKKTGHFELSKYSTTVNRGIIYATLEVNNQEMLALCTHLTANLTTSAPYVGSVPYKGNLEFKNGWAKENYFQTLKLIELGEVIAALESMKPGPWKKMPQVFMGDFNFGPSLRKYGIQGDFEKSYEYFLERGIKGANQKGVPKCTFCKYNSLTDGKEPNMILDHILIKNPPTKKDIFSQVVYKNRSRIKTQSGNIQHHISDHFGLMVEIPLK
jgi:endonuclease/exonuclease/phosphatase family metal-dependent hydrolase